MLTTHNSPFTFLPTYDIDIAWSYKHKGWWRSVGGLMQSLIKGRLAAIQGKNKCFKRKTKRSF